MAAETRTAVARLALDRALDDMAAVVRRVQRLRARLTRLQVAAAKSPEERSAAAEKAVATRTARQRRVRGIVVRP